MEDAPGRHFEARRAKHAPGTCRSCAGVMSSLDTDLAWPRSGQGNVTPFAAWRWRPSLRASALLESLSEDWDEAPCRDRGVYD